MAIVGAPPLTPAERAALEDDYRHGPSRLVRQRSHIILLATELETQGEIARVVHCSTDTVRTALDCYRTGGRSGLPRRKPQRLGQGKRTLVWQKALAAALESGPETCGVARPTWSARLLTVYLGENAGVAVSERTTRRGLDSLDYVCRRPTWTVRAKAEEQPDYHPKKKGSKPS